MNYPFISIIIPTLNEERHIVKCLESLKSQRYPGDRFEIIVVDNGSTDRTLNLCEKYTESIHVLPGVNVSELRNYGAGKARGEIYAFIDGDCEADGNWLANAVKSLETEPCVTGAYCEVPPDASWIERAWSARAPRGRREAAHIGTANLIVPADIFRSVGGFDPKLKTGEDYEFCTRLKGLAKVMLDDRIKVIHHGNPKTLKQFVKRELWHGLGALGSIRTQKIDKPLIGTVAFILFSVMQGIGILMFFRQAGPGWFFAGTLGLASLLAATVIAKNNRMDNPKSFLHLFVLFYFYYFARSVSLFLLACNRDFKRER